MYPPVTALPLVTTMDTRSPESTNSNFHHAPIQKSCSLDFVYDLDWFMFMLFNYLCYYCSHLVDHLPVLNLCLLDTVLDIACRLFNKTMTFTQCMLLPLVCTSDKCYTMITWKSLRHHQDSLKTEGCIISEQNAQVVQLTIKVHQLAEEIAKLALLHPPSPTLLNSNKYAGDQAAWRSFLL